MLASELIQQLQTKMATTGDVEVLSSDGFRVSGVKEVSGSQAPEAWCVPPGATVLVLRFLG
jgi:hypothetical protein